MVNLLSGIEEWVAGELGPLGSRVEAVEAAAEAAGGVVGSASEDRAVLALLFDRVQSLEEAAVAAPPPEEAAPAAPPPPAFAARFDAAAASRAATASVGGLDRRVRALERLVLGHAAGAQRAPPGGGLGGGLLADGAADGAAAAPADAASMSVTARLAVQEARFAKMQQDMEAMAGQIAALTRDLHAGGRPAHPFGAGGPAAAGLRKAPARGHPLAADRGPDMIAELKAATQRRAAKRRELGLTLLE